MRRIGRYEIETEIGRGSMGVVYLAHDPQVRRRIALKTYAVPSGLPAEEEQAFRGRFLREAQAAGALNHPAIVTIFDAGDDPDLGAPFIAMEYVEGQSLKDLLRTDGSLDPERAFAMAETLVSGLDAAHRAGVIHRDIKPANILVRAEDGAVKIADFGVARLETSELTRSGDTLGSPAYMSPEQIRGSTVDGRSDLFSLAIILYEALCGERPFCGDDVSALAYAIAHETPLPASRRRADLPPGIDEFFDRALAKDPDRRFQDGRAFGEAIVALRNGQSFRRSDAPAPDATLVEVPALGRFGRIASFAAVGRGIVRRHRRKSAAAALALVMGIGVWLIVAGNTATLVLVGENRFEDAVLTLTMDGERVYSRTLAAGRKRARMFGKELFEYGKEEFETTIRVRGGEHEIVAEVAAEGSERYRDRAIVVIASGETRRLKLHAGRSIRGGVSLETD